MTGKEFKEKVLSKIPDSAEIVILCGRYVAWRRPDGRMSCYSFYPERFCEDLGELMETEKGGSI